MSFLFKLVIFKAVAMGSDSPPKQPHVVFHRGERTVRALMQSFLRMQDPLRIIRFGIEHPEGDGRGKGRMIAIF